MVIRTGNKNFWKTVKPLLTDKLRSSKKISLVEQEKVATNDKEYADIWNNFLRSYLKVYLILPNATLNYRNYRSIFTIKKITDKDVAKKKGCQKML